MHLNTRLMKAQYRDKAGHRQVGFKTKTVERTAEKKVKTERKGFWSKFAAAFGFKLFNTLTTTEKWLERTVAPRYKRGGSKLGMRLHKSQVRAVAKIQRKQSLGQRVSLTDIMRTGMPVRPRDLRGAS